MIWQDVVRYFILAGAALLLGSTFLVCVVYFRRAVAAGLTWRQAFFPNREAETAWQGLLPWHVVAISASYDLFLIRSVVSALERWGMPDLNVLAVSLTAPAIVLGLAAMWIIGNTRKVVVDE